MLPFALPRSRGLAAVALFGLLLAAADPASAQPQPKKTLTFADYEGWRSATGVTLSRDGKHLAYLVGAENADGEAVVRNVNSGQEFRFARGSASGFAALGTAPRFSPGGKQVLIPLSPTKGELEKAKADKLKPDEFPKAGVAVVDLATGKEIERIAGAGTFQVGGTGEGFMIYRKGGAAPDAPKDGAPTPPTPPTTPTKGFGKKGTFQPPTGAPPAGTAAPARGGSDLYIRDLATGATRTVADVADYTLSNDDKALVYIVSGKAEDKNGVYVLNPNFGTAGSPIKSGAGRYSNLTWDEKQGRLAFFYDDSQVPPANQAPAPRPKGTPAGTAAPTAPPPPPRYRIFVWDRNAKAEAKAITRVPLGGFGALDALTTTAVSFNAPPSDALMQVYGPDTPGLKKGWNLSGSALSFSQDGTKLYLSAAPERPPQAPPAALPSPDDFQLDIWHWKDGNIQPMQKVTAGADRSRTFGAAVFLDTKQFKHLSNEDVTIQPPGVGDWAVGVDNRKYRHMTGYALPVPADYALVNVRTGDARPLATAATAGFNLSPSGKHLLTFDGKDWHAVTVPEGKRTNLTAKLKVKFFDEDFDQPSTPPPAGGAPSWTPDGKFVIVSDRYDLWKIAVDGSGFENLTKVGRATGVRYTLIKPRSPDDRSPVERTTDLTKPHLLFAENLTTRDTGFFRLEPGAEPRLLLMGARSYSNPVKAKDADVYLLTVQTFSQYPDYYVTGPDFHELKRVTDINPRVKEFNWGKAELIKYTSGDGKPLQAILIKPENFDPAKKYPMVVYLYERLTDTVHQFRVPNVQRGQVINPTFYASNGYLVLIPDVAYTVGSPGASALKCVLPAIQTVTDKGFVDEQAIGINGQSWGGYQIAYFVTQTNRFKAAVAGAPVSNMVSAYDGIRWGTGLPRQFQYEKSQSRIGAPLWDAPMKYIENSPVFMADRVQTPLMMIHNDQDDAVPWYQGIEYYLALRRLGKEVYLLNYNGEPHNLAKRAAARDFSVRMFQFFEHHLKGKPMPEWMEKGVPFLDRDKDKDQWKKLLGK